MQIKKLHIAFFVAFLLVGCATNGPRIDNIPMYGQPEIERPANLKKADEDFIVSATSKFGSRTKASQAWFNEAEQYMSERNFDVAMRRYNQSWLLDPENYQPYWGFGRVLLEQGKVNEAILQLESALSRCKDTYQKVAILSDAGSAYTVKGKSNPQYFKEANERFSESTVLDSQYPNSWRRWAFSLYEQGKYSEALEKVKKAQALGAKPLPPAFVSELEAKIHGANK